MAEDLLPSWGPGPAREALVAFLDAVLEVPVEERVACFDNDGTLWCEKPTYVQFDFFVDALKTKVHDDPSIGTSPEFHALLRGDTAAMGELGLERIAMALVGLFDGTTPESFTAAVRAFMAGATH